MEVVGIKFKNNCKEYYFSPNGLTLSVGEKVVVETPNGNTIASVVEGNKQVEEEKLIGKRHAYDTLPHESIKKCLEYANLELDEK